MKKKTKIVCTIGPASWNESTIRKMINAGMDAARFNFSHMPREKALEVLEMIDLIREEIGIPLPVMLDTKGPEVRLYGYSEELEVKRGDVITIESYTKSDIDTIKPPDKNHFYTNLPSVETLASAGSKVLLMDGFIEGEILSLEKTALRVKVKNRGVLRPRAHFAIPMAEYHLDFLSDKDREDILFAAENGFEYIALSFVSRSEDLAAVRSLINEKCPESKIQLISKIENKAAVKNLDSIICASNGIMVARGDLGVELDMAEVPVIQKQIIRKTLAHGVPVITATQMLESMIERPIPTRAEASDVANACFDMTSAVMLSGETAAGAYPVEVVKTMSHIIEMVEKQPEYGHKGPAGTPLQDEDDLTAAVNRSAVSLAEECGAKAIIVVTKTGHSARMLSKMRPQLPIWAFTYSRTTYHQLGLNWGIMPYMIMEETSFESMVRRIKEIALKEKIAASGEQIVIVGGLPLGRSGTTNMVRVETAG
jgi:pyruvate kinase